MILWYFKNSPHSRYTQPQLTPSACRRRTNLPRSDRSAAEPPAASPRLLAPPAPPQTPRNHRWNEGLRRVRSTSRGFFHSNPGSGCDFRTWWANGLDRSKPLEPLCWFTYLHLFALSLPQRRWWDSQYPGPVHRDIGYQSHSWKGDQKMNQNISK